MTFPDSAEATGILKILRQKQSAVQIINTPSPSSSGSGAVSSAGSVGELAALLDQLITIDKAILASQQPNELTPKSLPNGFTALAVNVASKLFSQSMKVRAMVFTNLGTATIYIGGSNMVTGTGIPVPSGTTPLIFFPPNGDYFDLSALYTMSASAKQEYALLVFQ